MKKLFLVLSCAYFALAAKADVLYFQIVASSDTGISCSDGKYYFHGHQITGIDVRYTDGGTSGSLNDYSETGFGFAPEDFMTDEQFDGNNGLGEINLSDLADFSSYSYYIELIGYDEAAFGGETGVVGVSETRTYTDLLQGGYIVTATAEITPAWTGGTYNVPEPSGALLLLVGAALMGLKRRKV